MQILKFLTIIAATSASTVSAKCFLTGAKGNKSAAYHALPALCTALQGYYKGEEKRQLCAADTDESKKWIFEVKNINGGGELTYDACMSGLTKEVHNCDRGGAKGYKNWHYR